MHLTPDSAIFESRLAAFPIATYEAGETVLAAGSRTDRLLILKSGKVAIVKKNIEIATAAESGAVFGELSALLNQPHAADVCALEASLFHVAEAAALLRGIEARSFTLRQSWRGGSKVRMRSSLSSRARFGPVSHVVR